MAPTLFPTSCIMVDNSDPPPSWIKVQGLYLRPPLPPSIDSHSEEAMAEFLSLHARLHSTESWSGGTTNPEEDALDWSTLGTTPKVDSLIGGEKAETQNLSGRADRQKTRWYDLSDHLTALHAAFPPRSMSTLTARRAEYQASQNRRQRNQDNSAPSTEREDGTTTTTVMRRDESAAAATAMTSRCCDDDNADADGES
ncbi:hypothetical protein V8E53_004063 [Lactarius tabidus]